MLFANPHNVTIAKEIQGVRYTCAPGEFVEIPDKLAYVIKVEGVMLVPADELTASKAQQKSVEKPADKQPERKDRK